VLIAGIGFINYILMRWLGERGMEITAFFGGLVNSRKVVVELASRFQELGAGFQVTFQRGILLATTAILIRNAIIVALLAPRAMLPASIPAGLMFATGMFLLCRTYRTTQTTRRTALELESPFKLPAALKFGVVFLMLNVVGALAQRQFGSNSFYFVSMAGGLLSSASSIASAANLASRGEISVVTGANGILLSSIVSILVNIPLLRSMDRNGPGWKKPGMGLAWIAAAGLLGMVVNHLAFP